MTQYEKLSLMLLTNIAKSLNALMIQPTVPPRTETATQAITEHMSDTARILKIVAEAVEADKA